MKRSDCAKCGACTPVCPVYRVTGRESFTARGKLHLFEKLQGADQTTAYENIFNTCLLCGACHEACPRNVDTPTFIIDARGRQNKISGKSLLHKIIQQTLTSQGLLSKLGKVSKAAYDRLLKRLPKESGLRYKLSFLDPEDWQPAVQNNLLPASISGKAPAHEIAYFAGCFAKHFQPGIVADTCQLLNITGHRQPLMPDAKTCCGLAHFSAGNKLETEKLAQKNIEAFEGNNLPILTSCASCYSHLRSYPALFKENDAWHERAIDFVSRLREFTSYFLEKFLEADQLLKKSTSSSLRVVYHDPCHLRFKEKITAEPRKLLKIFPNLETMELPHGPQCCGQGGFFDILRPAISKNIMQKLLADFSNLSAYMVTTTCTGCLIQWQRALKSSGSETKVAHTATLIVNAFNHGKTD